MKHITVGIVAHVDAGKTTLSEAMLYHSGQLRKLGRVDKGDAFLDPDDLEKQRGITIFFPSSKLTIRRSRSNHVRYAGTRGFCGSNRVSP